MDWKWPNELRFFFIYPNYMYIYIPFIYFTDGNSCFLRFSLNYSKITIKYTKINHAIFKKQNIVFFFNKNKIFLQVVIFKSILNGINNFIELFFLKV